MAIEPANDPSDVNLKHSKIAYGNVYEMCKHDKPDATRRQLKLFQKPGEHRIYIILKRRDAGTPTHTHMHSLVCVYLDVEMLQ